MLKQSELKQLLEEQESDYLDFKQQFPEDNIDLIHDILCMANVISEKDRYLIYGVTDDGVIVGIENDPNKKTQANILDYVSQSNFNRIPRIRLQDFQLDGHVIATLIISNRREKPYFLTKDKTHNKKTIRAGVVYSRLGDTNVPLKKSSTESKIEHMWRERFRLDLSPAERLSYYLDDPENWKKIDGVNNYHYVPFPEFQLIASREEQRPFKVEWTEKFPDKEAFRLEMDAIYHSTILERHTIIECDGGRYYLPLPQLDVVNDVQKWRIDKNSPIYRISRLFRQCQDLDETMNSIGIVIID